MKKNLRVARFLAALLPVLTTSAAAQVSSHVTTSGRLPLIVGANRVFVAAKSGNNANACASVSTPCQTFAGAYAQVAAGGEIIVLESGGYGPLTITGPVAIDAPAGVTAFVHPPSGDAITVNAGSSDRVILRGLTLNGGTNHGIAVTSVGTLTVENCFITAFFNDGIHLGSGGQLTLKGTDITGCGHGVAIYTSGVVLASVDHCHLDGNSYGFVVSTTSPGSSTTTATFTTTNNNSFSGWWCGDNGSSGKDVINLESCSVSENGSGSTVGAIVGASGNAQSVLRYSNCVMANNVDAAIKNYTSGTFESRGNNTVTGNGALNSGGGLGTFSPN